MATTSLREQSSPAEPLKPQPTDSEPLRWRTEEWRRRELAVFLRNRRERIAPQQVGLPPGGRRRTSGLRREEVAQLAGIGVTWYTWLEQGRDIVVSDSVLEAIARTLLLEPQERSHLFTLAGAQPPALQYECPVVTPAMRVLLEKMDPFPVGIQSPRYDLLAYNRTYARMIDDLEQIPPDERNTLWLSFTHPAWRVGLVDWEDAVSRMVAQYRAAMAEHVGEPGWKSLLKRLRAVSPEFVEVWERHEVRAPENHTKRFLNPLVGLMQFHHTHLWLGPQHGTRMVSYVPADDESARRLKRLSQLTA